MSKLRISIFILVMLGLGSKALAQESDYAIKLDSVIHKKWAPTGLRFGFDVSGPIYSYIQSTKSSYEGSVDIDFNRFFGVIEVGNGVYSAGGDTTSYSSSGMFYRVGADVNLTPKDPNLNVVFFGLRYASSTFDEKLKGVILDSGWGTQIIDNQQSNSRANWIEMNLGMRARIWKSFFAGYSLRLKFLKHNTFNESNLESYYIPAYGLAEKINNWSFSYYLQYRFEWKKKPIKWREE